MEVRHGHCMTKPEQTLFRRSRNSNIDTMLIWMMGIKRIEKIRNEEIRPRAGVANISEKIREARLRWLRHV